MDEHDITVMFSKSPSLKKLGGTFQRIYCNCLMILIFFFKHKRLHIKLLFALFYNIDDKNKVNFPVE